MFFFYKLPFKYFLGLGCHIGSRFHLWSVETSPNVLFKMLEYPVINLTSTSFNFISAINFIKFCTSRNLKPLFFFPRGFEIYLNLKIKNWNYAYCLVHYWLPGFFSNFKFIFNKDKFKSIPLNCLNVKRYPDFVIFLGISNRSQHLVSADARISRMPSIGLNDVDMGPSLFNYSIFSNSKSFVLAFHFYKLFFSAVIDGFKFFSGNLASKLFKFYKQFLVNKFPKAFNNIKKLKNSAIGFKKFSNRIINTEFKVVTKVFYRYPQRRDHGFCQSRFFRFFQTFHANFFSPWKSNLFLAHFSYSILLNFSQKFKKFQKLRYSKKNSTIKFIFVDFKKFFRFKKLLNFFKQKIDLFFINVQKFVFFRSRDSIRVKIYRRKNVPLPRSVLRRVVKKFRFKKFKKFNKYGKYTPLFLKFQKKRYKVYDGSNAVKQIKQKIIAKNYEIPFFEKFLKKSPKLKTKKVFVPTLSSQNKQAFYADQSKGANNIKFFNKKYEKLLFNV